MLKVGKYENPSGNGLLGWDLYEASHPTSTPPEFLLKGLRASVRASQTAIEGRVGKENREAQKGDFEPCLL